MNAVPVLAIIVLAPIAGALLIALFGRGQNAPRAIALVAGSVSLGLSLWVFATYDRAVAGYQFVESAALDPVASAPGSHSESTASRCRCSS